LRWGSPILATVWLNRDGGEKDGWQVVAGSDRIPWLCSSFTILKWKLKEELAEDPPANGTHKLVITDTRCGPAMLLVDKVPSLPSATGCYRRPIRVLLDDKAHGTPAAPDGSKRRGVISPLDRPGGISRPGVGGIRNVVERTLASVGHCRRIRLCYERRPEHFQATFSGGPVPPFPLLWLRSTLYEPL
jgi:hypothetical protein